MAAVTAGPIYQLTGDRPVHDAHHMETIRTSRRDTTDDGGPAWEGTDYLLRGEFCTPEAIARELARLRRDCGAAVALMLVAGPRSLLKSLSMADSHDGRGQALTDVLRRRGLRTRRHLRPLGLPGGDSFPGSAPRLLRRLGDAIDNDKDGPGSSGELVGDPEDWSALQVPAQLRGTRLAVALLLHFDDSAVHPRVITDRDAATVRLTIMVNATAQARVHHDTLVMDRVDDALVDSVGSGGQIDLAAAADKLVALAMEVTSSDLAAYYAADVPGRRLWLRATTTKPRDRVVPAQALGLSALRVASVSADRARPVIFDLASAPEIELSFDVAGRGHHVAEMATPVRGPLATGAVLGVVTVARCGTTRRLPKAFGAYDLALVRNVALRLSLLRATADLEATADLFSSLTATRTRRSYDIPAPQDQAPTLGAAGSECPVGSGGLADPDRLAEQSGAAHSSVVALPDDLAIAMPDIERGLRTIRELTGSQSATFRAALPHPDATSAHGLALHRIAADPPERLGDERAVQQLDEDRVNCLSARLGRPHNVPFAVLDEHFDAVRPGSSSAMSVPVIVEGMVAGVVNLESTFEQNYDTRTSTVVAFAEHIGLVIADARLALSRQMEEYALEIITLAHDIPTECDAISAALAGEAATPSARSDAERRLGTIRSRARGIESYGVGTAPPKPSAAPATMPEIVEAALDHEDVCRVNTVVAPGDWPRHATEAVERARECLRHMFANVHRHRELSAEAVKVKVTCAEWGGRVHDVVQIINQTELPVDRARARNAYRVPVTSAGVDADGAPIEIPRFGAYLAGGQARAVAGDAHLCALSDHVARVVLMVPRPDESAA